MEISSMCESGVYTIIADGEVDVANADGLRQALSIALDSEPSKIQIDMAHISYIDSTGIGVLVGARQKAEEANVAFTLLKPQDNVLRVLRLLGLDTDLNIQQ